MAAKIVWYSFYLLRPMLSAYHAVVRISGFINEPNVVCFFLLDWREGRRSHITRKKYSGG